MDKRMIRGASAAMLSALLMALPGSLPAAAEETYFFVQDDAETLAEASPGGDAWDGDVVFTDGTPSPDAAPAATLPPEEDALPLLVNGNYPVKESYKPDDLVLMNDYCDADIVRIKGAEIEGSRVAVDALMAMLGAAIEDGIADWQISSGYRSVAYQQEMWDDRVYRYRKEDGMTGSQARAAAGRYMARPGASEHHTGLAFDVTVPGEVSFAATDQCAWLHEHCWEYGFIIRFYEEKQPITGIHEEPWHIRYVGLPHSKLMQASGECLEEYLGLVE